MTIERFSHLAQNWRLNKERLKLSGNECDICGKKFFPPKEICPDCEYEVVGTKLGTSTVEVVLEKTINQKREVELGMRLNENIEFSINLNGKSHALKFTAGMQIPVFMRKSMKGKEPIYSVDLNPWSSK